MADSWTGNTSKQNATWWRSRRDAVGEEVYATVRAIKRSNGSRDRRLADMHHLRLYTNYDVAGDGRRPQTGLFRTEDGRIRYNLIASAVDTAASVIAQQRPRPMFLTTQGDFALQNKARKRTRALEGQLYDLGVYDMGPECFRDGAVLGTGFIYGYLDEENRPKCERCLPLEVVVDHSEGVAGKPRSIYRCRTVAREVLQALYPSAKKKLEQSAGPTADELVEFQLQRDSLTDRVLVVEAWHLESRKGAGDGRHVIAVSNATLLDEPYTRRRLPFAVYRWQTRPMGFYGMGIAERGRDPQWRVNKLIRQYERLQDLGTNTWLLVEGNSKVRVESITNKPMEIVRYFGTPPTPLQLNAVPPGLQAEIDSIREQFFSELGISTMLAEGKKPSGLDSGQAQRTHDDILSRRHVMNAKSYEAFYMDVCDLLIDLNDQATDLDENFAVASTTTRGRQQYIADVKWADVQMDEGDSRLRMFPTSALPTTPQGKFAQIQEYIASGWISKPFGMALMDMPDLDAATRIELADMDAVMSDIERILDGEDGVYPEPYQSLEMALYVSRRSYLQAKIAGAPEDVLQAFRDYVDAALEMTQAGADVGQQAAAATQAMTAEQPQPVPGAQAAPPTVPGGMTMQ